MPQTTMGTYGSTQAVPQTAMGNYRSVQAMPQTAMSSYGSTQAVPQTAPVTYMAAQSMPQTATVTYMPAEPMSQSQMNTYTVVQPVAQPQMMRQMQPMPMGSEQMQPIFVNEPPTAEPAQEAGPERPNMPIRKEFQKKIGCSDDYTWITGQLFRLHVDGGIWVVRYATLDQVDRFGGSVVLAPAVNMKNYREGDLVCITGEILNQGRANRYAGGPLFRVDHIDLFERAD
jgi:hypothetical protein